MTIPDMSDIENATPAVEDPDKLALVHDQAAAKEKAGKEEGEDDD